MTHVLNIHRGASAEHAEVVAAMKQPSFYPHHPGAVELRETHTSAVFLAGDRAYKLKKPVRFPFLDYRSLATRRRMCAEELRLNRRLARSVYLAVRSVVRSRDAYALAAEDDPAAVDYVVEMRRFDESVTLASRVSHHAAGSREIDEVAARIASFHAQLEPAAPVRDPRREVKRTADDNFASLLELVPAAMEPDVVGAQRFSDAFLVHRREMLFERAAGGYVRDGHGDLRAEHILLERPVEIVDCLEFDPSLRLTDVASDLAFLVMDLHRLGAPALARALVDAYRRHGGNPGDDGLLAFYCAQRAWVRAKVSMLRAVQLEAAGEDSRDAQIEGRRLLELGRRFAWRARQPLMLVICGLSGSGKTHLANTLASVSGFEVLSSDVARKRLAGIEPVRAAAPSHYTAAFSERTYSELGALAADALERDGGVIVDATCRHADERKAFRNTAGEAFAHARFVECLTPTALRLRRVEARQPGSTASDATADIASSQTFDALAELPAGHHLPLRTDRSVHACAAAVEQWLDQMPG
ncbi:MAG TPA: AAA family ATPase [Thermoleophilaceae bacterium]